MEREECGEVETAKERNSTKPAGDGPNYLTKAAQLCFGFRPVLKAAPYSLPLPNTIMQC